MHHRVRFLLLFVCLLTLAACGSTTAGNSSPTAPPTTAQSTPTNTPASGMTVYTSPDHTYHISYPSGWQAQPADGNPGKVDFSGPNQNFEVTDDAGTKGADPAQLITDYCNAIGQTTSQVVTGTPVVLAGQTWFKAQCGDDPQPSEPLVVEVVTYQGAVYQIDYSSPAASFQADDTAYYAPMEQSFQFLT
ncbi:MAG TPA: hypothetical protein VKT82_31545 [Ktedonobacterales bacterium]|nr:hypothetical protein [Ktedonobacterales bacterium]